MNAKLNVRLLVLVVSALLTFSLATVVGAQEQEPVVIKVNDVDPELPSDISRIYDNPGTAMRYASVAMFQALNPNIKLEGVDWGSWWSGTDAWQKMLTGLASRTAPAIFPVYQDNPQAMIEQGMLADLTPFVEQWEKRNQIPMTLWENSWRDGKVYAIPVNYYRTVNVIYRKDWFGDAGLAAPWDDWTVDDWVTYAQKISDPQQNRRSWTILAGDWGAGWHYGEYWHPTVSGNHFPWAVPNDSGTGWQAAPAEVWAESLAFYQDAVKGGYAFGDSTTAWGSDFRDFDSGRVGMMHHYSSMFTGYLNNAGRDGHLDLDQIGLAPFPKHSGGYGTTQSGTNYWAIASYLTDAEKEAAWKWLEWFVAGGNEDLEWMWASQRGVLRNFPTLYTEVPQSLLDRAPDFFIDAVDEALARPQPEVTAVAHGVPFTQLGPMKDAMLAPIQAVLSNLNMDPLAAARQFVQQVNFDVLNEPVEGADRAKFGAYFRALGDFYSQNFREYYESEWLPMYGEYTQW